MSIFPFQNEAVKIKECPSTVLIGCIPGSGGTVQFYDGYTCIQ